MLLFIPCSALSAELELPWNPGSKLNSKLCRLLKERDELNDQVSTLQIEMGLKASPLEGNH